MLRHLLPKSKNYLILKTLHNPKLNCFRGFSEAGSEFYDVTISGSGLIGGAMACSLGLSPHMKNKKVLVLETQSAPAAHLTAFDPSQPYSNRVCAISPASRSLLEKLGVWERIGRKSNVKKMQIWDASSDALLDFNKNEMTEDLCYIVENNLITSNLTKLLHEDCQNVDVRYSTKIKSCSLPRNYAQDEVNDPIPNVELKLENGSEIETSLLIAADGANSFVAKQANFSKIAWQYDQSAVVATLKLSEPLENIVAWQRFLPTGPIAMLPLDDVHSSLVWTTSHDHASQLIEMEEDGFITEVNDAFWKEYPKNGYVKIAQNFFQPILDGGQKDKSSQIQFPPTVAELQGNRAKFPLGINHCTEYVRPRLALIGDAAHRVHPLAGQGANLGFGDVERLVSDIEQALYEGKDIGCLSHLLKFEQERQARNAPVMAVIDGLQKLYSTTSLPIVVLRTLGLMGVNSSHSIKELIINQATR